MNSRDALTEIAEMVARQAEDEGLWFEAERAPETYLQQELRKLHAVVERCMADSKHEENEA